MWILVHALAAIGVGIVELCDVAQQIVEADRARLRAAERNIERQKLL